MPDIREIRERINSIKDTQKVTDAMYMIASTKLRKARNELDSTRPYFEAISKEIKNILRIDSRLESRFFYPPSGVDELKPPYGYLVITSDKGLAGSYNMQVLKETEKQFRMHGEGKLFVVGEFGRRYFRKRKIPIVEDFDFSPENVDLERAREITRYVMSFYEKGEINKLYLVYTDLRSAVYQMASFDRILPFHRADFHSPEEKEKKQLSSEYTFYPSMNAILVRLVESYVTGFIYSALVDSYCCEQNSRMNAMDEANKNAESILAELSVQYNHVRQGKITQEITEISAGAKALRRKKAHKV